MPKLTRNQKARLVWLVAIALVAALVAVLFVSTGDGGYALAVPSYGTPMQDDEVAGSIGNCRRLRHLASSLQRIVVASDFAAVR